MSPSKALPRLGLAPSSRLLVASSALLALLVTGCKDGWNSDWRTDMWYQASHRTLSLSRPEPPHSVALGAGPLIADPDDSEDLKNPVAAEAGSRAHGQTLFRERCSCCHGDKGHGGGPVSKFFPPAPDLAYVTIKQRTDGRLFGTITAGGRAMPPMAEGLTPRDRWDLVNYVRALQADSGTP